MRDHCGKDETCCGHGCVDLTADADNGMDAWDHLAYVAQITCETTGQWLEVNLSMYEGNGLWFGAHDLPQGGGHMTDVCLAEGP